MYETIEEIKIWLNLMSIKNYVINEDLTVDVNGSVEISYKELKEIPIRFSKVNDNFYCNNNSLTSLKGCPKVVNGGFYCYNNKLTSLEGCPEVVKGNFYCYNNNLINLEYCPQVINGSFSCNNNELTNFEYFPKEINGNSINILQNKIKEEELVNFNYDITNIKYLYSEFNEDGDKEEFLVKVNYYKNIKKENELLKDLSINSNNVKLNKKL